MMESVDELLLCTLSAGIHDNSLLQKAKGVADFDLPTLVSCIGQALRAILKDENIPVSVGEGIGDRQRICSFLSSKVRALGYENIQYSTILYPVEAEVRQILTFLVAKLPKHDFRDPLIDAISFWNSQTWKPRCFLDDEDDVKGFGKVTQKKYNSRYNTQHNNSDHLSQSAIDNIVRLAMRNAFTQTSDTTQEEDIALPSMNESRGVLFSDDTFSRTTSKEALKAELEELRTALDTAYTKSEDVRNELDVVNLHLDSLQRKTEEKTEFLKQLKRQCEIKHKVVSTLKPGDKSAQTLNEELAMAKERHAALQTEWKSISEPLRQQLTKHEKEVLEHRQAIIHLKQSILNMNEQYNTMREKINVLSSRQQMLEKQIAASSVTIERSSLTARLLDIVQQIRKQDKAMQAIVVDIRQVQREINALVQKLARTEAIVNEVVGSAETPTSHSTTETVTLRNKVDNMQALFEKLRSGVDRVAKIHNTTRDVQLRAENLLQRVSLERLEKAKRDLEVIRKENKDLLAVEKTPTTPAT